MALVVEIKITNPDRIGRSKRSNPLELLSTLVIQNIVGHPEAPYRANYQAKFYSAGGTLVETVEIADFDRSHGAMRLVKAVLDKKCPTHLQFQEAEMFKLLRGVDDKSDQI